MTPYKEMLSAIAENRWELLSTATVTAFATTILGIADDYDGYSVAIVYLLIAVVALSMVSMYLRGKRRGLEYVLRGAAKAQSEHQTEEEGESSHVEKD